MRMRHVVLLTLMAVFVSAVAQVGTSQQNAARNAGADWPTMNRDSAGTRYSPLTQITTANVAQLTKAWSYRLQPETGNLTGSEVFQEVTPIVVNGVMYLPAGNRVVALD